ncbi:MAG: 2-dehydropantoate 2-reductase [Alphaproteobacteria bacterium]|nr:2-dehydropantoate 2-reductase [Alphaproteobacteria bacterium]
MTTNPIKRVCVAGAGAIGSLFAGHFDSVAVSTVLTRRQEHADQLNRLGLRVSGKSERQARVIASTNPADLGDVDLVIIATKASAVEETAKSMKGHFPNALVMTVQNGLGCEEVVARYGDWPILSSVTFMSGNRHSDVHVEYELDTATWIGPWAKRHASYAQAQAVAALIEAAGLKAEAFPDLLPAQWSKLIFNATINSISAISDLPHVRSFAQTGAFGDLGHLVRAMMDEGKRVAEGLGIKLFEDPWEMNVKAVDHGQTGDDDYAHAPSMLEDVRARRLTEVDWINGAIVRGAAEIGLPVPINDTLFRLVKARESSWRLNRGSGHGSAAASQSKP